MNAEISFTVLRKTENAYTMTVDKDVGTKNSYTPVLNLEYMVSHDCA
jgi:hypothetical protein